MTTTYRYLFADLLTNEIIGELPLICGYHSSLYPTGIWNS
jgi:hypothetical protein